VSYHPYQLNGKFQTDNPKEDIIANDGIDELDTNA
jgi:hypothetical protein